VRVGWIGHVHEAAQRLDKSPSELWPADYYVMSDPYQAEPYDPIDISQIADVLRFKSQSGNDRLPAYNRPQALQSMRVLTKESVQLLEEIWFDEATLLANPVPVVIEGQNSTFSEGRRKLHLHFRRERDSRLV